LSLLEFKITQYHNQVEYGPLTNLVIISDVTLMANGTLHI